MSGEIMESERLKECIEMAHWGDTVLEDAEQEEALEKLVDEYLIKKIKERIPSMKHSIKVDIDTV